MDDNQQQRSPAISISARKTGGSSSQEHSYSPAGSAGSLSQSRRTHSVQSFSLSTTPTSAGGPPAGGARKVQVGFTPSTSIPTASSSANSSRKQSAAVVGANNTSTSILSSSYKSQIPGWSAEDVAETSGAMAAISALSSASSSTGATSSLLPSAAIAGSANASSSQLSATDNANSSDKAGTGSGDVAAATEKPMSKADKKALKLARRAQKQPQTPFQHQQQQQQTTISAQLPSAGTKQQQQQQPSSGRHHDRKQTGNAASSSTVHAASSGADLRDKRAASAAPNARTSTAKEVALFSHLAICSKSSKAPQLLRAEMKAKDQSLHPAVVKLGLLYQSYSIVGSNNRAIALMQTFRQVIADYTTPSNTALCRHLDSYLKPQINYLVSCRPISVSMGNAIRYLKLEIAAVPPDMPEDDAKKHLDERILNFIRDRIQIAQTLICESAVKKIRDDDVIMVFGNSAVIKKLLVSAHGEHGIQFRVIVVDSRPLLEGKKLLKDLVEAGIPCIYVHLNALSYALKDSSKVIIGAHALLSNGYVMARVGTAMVAMMAHEKRIPVICCCESYKFSDRVQLDSFVMNELGDADDLVQAYNYQCVKDSVLFAQKSEELQEKQGQQKNCLSEWRDIPDLKLLNLLYDVTPSEFITVVITEVGLIPCSSVPVVLREGVKTSQHQLRQQHSHHGHLAMTI